MVIPAAVRAVLGVGAGDRIRFTVRDGEVRIVTARSLLTAVWANNHGGDAGDAVNDVREVRTEDQSHVAAKWDRVGASHADESRSEDAIEADLLTALDLPR